MVVRRATYPQVDPRAIGLMTKALTVVPASLPVEEAVRLGRRRRARLLVARIGADWGGVIPATLEHALRLGLHRVAVRAVLWRMALVEPDTPEVAVRRRLGPASPFVLLVGPDGPVGAVLLDPDSGGALPLSIAEALGRLPEATRRILRSAGSLGDELGWAVVGVGGLVRDLLLPGSALSRSDLDLAVEGDGRALARRLAQDLGGIVREHSAFLTATVELPKGQRIDVATTRRERYAAPGALPEVEPASVASDLERRDFSVNALAVRLNAGAWGQVVDVAGGLLDLRHRRIRVLHALSFVEDPTRILRAVRFALRLGCRLDPATRRLLSAAAALPTYATLSGDRLRAEFGAVLAEPDPAAVLAQLGRMGGFRLLLSTYRFRASTEGLLRAVAERTAGLPVAPETREALYVLALTAHLTPDAVAAWTRRLGLPAAAGARIARARDESGDLLAGLSGAAGPGEAYAVLRRVPELVAAWAHVCARGVGTRRHIAEHLRHWREIRPLLTGDDLQALGFSPGPALGGLLEELRVAQVTGRVRHRDDAVAWARAAAARRRRRPRRSDTTNQPRPGKRGG